MGREKDRKLRKRKRRWKLRKLEGGLAQTKGLKKRVWSIKLVASASTR